ncbi:helix-turn-helix domain-containing protein [Bacteroides sp.]|uniref:AraC family transcriptional regulator n=1 Tax=Bacteroides sp. TaxID=29523 RepID=UPI0026296F39|nr:helix-turn-helix domain-containing protein [Bacteroides sp.]MDD3036940.1 helix-turn-helix domain-containing protein [Bacteroides sp.]
MIEEYYSQIQVIVWVLLLVTGNYLLFGKVPDKTVIDVYRKSRKIMGFAFLVYCVQFFLQWKFSVRDEFPQAASALNITFFYLASVLLGFSFISLLDRKYLSRKRVVIDLSVCAVVAVMVWGSIVFMSYTVSFWVLMLAALWLFIYVAHISLIFFRTYYNVVKKIKNYHSDNVDIFIQWMSKSVFLAIIMGLLCSTMAFAPKWMITIYLIASIPFFFYIFCCFIDYLVYYEEVEDAIVNELPVTTDENLSTESETEKSLKLQLLKEHLQVWIENKGYLQPKINLTELARKMGSNRSYLSDYINSNYSCSFYQWIARLRIEDTKKLLLEEPDLPILLVAERMGFSSGSHLTRLFTQQEQQSPVSWRKEHTGK